MKKRLLSLLLLMLVACFAFSGCGGDDDDDDSSSKKKKTEPTETVNEVTPTDDVTPTENPTEEPAGKLSYDPEKVVVFEGIKLRSPYDTNIKYFCSEENGKNGDPQGYAIVRRSTSEPGYSDMELAGSWKTICEENNLYYDAGYNGTSLAPYAIPWDRDFMYMERMVQNFGTEITDMTTLESCMVFVKDGESFDIKELLTKAQAEKGSDYTLDQMIHDEYAGIVHIDVDHNDVCPYRPAFTRVDIKRVFPEPGVYKVYVYAFFMKSQEWHRVTYDPIETMRYNVINYADYDLVMEIVDR